MDFLAADHDGSADRDPPGDNEGVHFHDLRHAGNQLTADAGANL